jgi:hypothetical protein
LNASRDDNSSCPVDVSEDDDVNSLSIVDDPEKSDSQDDGMKHIIDNDIFRDFSISFMELTLHLNVLLNIARCYRI